MATPQLTPEQVHQVSELVSAYITTQRQRFLPQAVPLTAAQMAAMGGFFRPEVLNTTRLFVLLNGRIDNPDFYPILRGWGFTNLPDFSLTAAATFGDVIVSHEPFSDGLLFHELVHVEQYRQLGVPRFAELYVRGFLMGGGYDGIPLERNAYDLGEKFEMNRSSRFSTEDEVGKWIREKLF